jgi:molecular chaperone HscB
MDNYFELYELPVNFHPDAAKVKTKYYEFSRLYHPDRFAQADNTKKLEALTMAALNNKAYKTLSNADATMAYVLKLNEVLKDEEKYNLPPVFLMEMMDFNESVSEYEANPTNNTLREELEKTLADMLADWSKSAETLTCGYDTAHNNHEELLKIKDMYFRKKYLLRIQERITKFALR